MRPAPLPLLLLLLTGGLLSCAGADAGGDGPACGGGFSDETPDRYGHLSGAECLLEFYETGVVVRLSSASWDRGWVLSGTAGDEPFACAVVPGMVEGDPCSENQQIAWRPTGEDAPPLVWLRAHPCRLSLRLEVDGQQVASGAFEPEYEWSEPNGVGCGWVGVASVEL